MNIIPLIKKRNITFVIISLLCFYNVSAQRGHSQYGNKLTGNIYGKVIDQQSKNPINYATISLISDTEGKLITGTISDDKGNYSIEDIDGGIYQLKVSFIGYTDVFIKDIQINRKKTTHQMATVVLVPSVILDEVVIDGTTPTISYEIDKKIVDVSNLNTDHSQTAVEILENIPSITVNDDGGINLRGSSSFTLLIDGKPTAMEASDALATIPASVIKNIEIITNPSAKYDAEGVSGIINIVLKQNKLKGISLLANINAGSFGNFGGDIAVNIRRKKWGLNLNASHNNRNRPSHRTMDRVREEENYTSTIHSEHANVRKMIMSKINAELVYEPNAYHSFVIGATNNGFEMNSDNDIVYRTSRSDTFIIIKDRNLENNIRDFKSWNANITYRYQIKQDKSHYVEFRSAYSAWDGEELLLTDYYDRNNNLVGGTKRTETGPSGVLRFNIDYSKKIGKGKFESGVQVQYGLAKDDSDNYDLNPGTNEYIHNDLFSKDVEYKRNVNAAYALYGNKYQNLGYQFGLRLEHTNRKVTATNSPDFARIERFDLFPSVHLSYKLTDDQEVLVNYSKRINRPRSYHFEPFITWYSKYDLGSGNPNLKPEYIDVFEINWIKKLYKKGSIGMELYFRNTKNLIQRTETVYEDDILIRFPVNIGKSMSVGLQTSLSYKLYKWWKTDLSFNFYNYKISGELADKSYNKESFNWDSRWTNTFPLKNNWRIQLVTNYNSRTTTIQGYRKAFVSLNTSIKKSFLKNKYALTLQGRNILGSRKNESFFVTDNISVTSLKVPMSPMLSLSFSMKLNNYKYREKSKSVNDI